MKRYLLNKKSTGDQAKRFFLLFLLAVFLSTTCPVKKSINLILFDSAGVENFGLNDQKTTDKNKSLIFKGSISCSIFEMVTPAKGDPHSPTVPLPLYPISLAFFILLPEWYALSMLTGFANYYEEFAFPASLTPIYIRNRQLLI